jgi:hypothetical protein
MDNQASQPHTTPLVDYSLFDSADGKRVYRKPYVTTNKRRNVDIDNVASKAPKQIPRVTVSSERRLKKAKEVGVKPRSLYYLYAQQFTQEAIEMMVYLMRTSRNEGIRLGAARSILDKSIPDLKALEISGELKQQYQVQLQQYAPTDPLQSFNVRTNTVPTIQGETIEVEADSDVLQDTMSHNKGSATLPSLDNEDNSTISLNNTENTNSTQSSTVHA